MGEVFNGWRRKVGVVTLVVACAFVAAWTRSATQHDWIRWQSTNSSYQISSIEGIIRAMRLYPGGEPSFTWGTLNFGRFQSILHAQSRLHARYDPIGLYDRVDWRIDCGGFHVATGRGCVGCREFKSCAIPYWSLATTLTLLSAYLLLVKPRVTKPAPDARK